MEWASYVNPIALLWLYYVLVLEARFLLKPQVGIVFVFDRIDSSFDTKKHVPLFSSLLG